jgi:hypothetical protein
MPVWFHRILGWFVERMMTVPLVSTAQVQMLHEGLAAPAPPCDLVPVELASRIPFGEEQIRAGLPAPGPFTWRDLRLWNQRKMRDHFDNVFLTLP